MNNEKDHASITVTGGTNIIALQADAATQNFNSQATPQSAPQEAVLPTSLEGEYHHFITHDAVGVPQMICQAHRHIVLHAAYYPKYGVDDQGMYLVQAMEQNTSLRLTAVFTDVTNVVWADEFARSLRPHFTAQKFARHLEDSKDVFTLCLEQFGPKRVHIYDTSRLPMFPIIMIDETLIIGHYAHSSVIPPHGLWLTIKHPSIPTMYENLLAGIPTTCKTAEERALLRYVEELIVTP